MWYRFMVMDSILMVIQSLFSLKRHKMGNLKLGLSTWEELLGSSLALKILSIFLLWACVESKLSSSLYKHKRLVFKFLTRVCSRIWLLTHKENINAKVTPKMVTQWWFLGARVVDLLWMANFLKISFKNTKEQSFTQITLDGR